MLTIYKASAGSGKTHTLTGEYLRLCLSQPNGQGYRRIQAVTFTNKATEEMKGRIATELYKIASGTPSDFASMLTRELGLSDSALEERASRALRSMLLDYSGFRVSTIDAFFQEILRGFARELGLQGGVRPSLESALAIEDAITAVIAEQDSLPSDAKVWIRDITHELIDQGAHFDLRGPLRKLSKALLSDEQVKSLALEGKLPSRAELLPFKRYLTNRQEAIAQELARSSRAVLEAFERTGLAIERISRGASGALALCLESQTVEQASLWLRTQKTPLKLKSYFVKFCQGEPLCKKNDHEGNALIEGSPVRTLACQLRDFVLSAYPEFRSTQVVHANLGSYGLILEIQSKLHEQQREEGSMLLSDTPALINRILSDEGASDFIYEKIGTRIDHQMIDEFQDTSAMQYLDFLPLLRNSIASGYANLVVGDVKQSIYRWRGSDSKLLGEQVGHDFPSPEYSREVTLAHNWRSTPAIVHFNNALYNALPRVLEGAFASYIREGQAGNIFLQEAEGIEVLAETFTHYYRDTEQVVPERNKDKRGLVAIHHFSSEATRSSEGDGEPADAEGGDDESSSLARGAGLSYDPAHVEYQLPRVIVDLQRRGYRACDIAILVRATSQAQKIARVLEEAGQDAGITEGGRYSLGFISQEALRIDRSRAVRFVIALLSYMSHPEGELYRHEVRELFAQLMSLRGEEGRCFDEADFEAILDLGKRSIYETIEALVQRYRDAFDPEGGDYPYLIKLLDIALGAQQDLSLDLSDFLILWEGKGDSPGKRASTLVTPEDEHKLILTTIHKSKGLDYPVVLIPYPSWRLNAVGVGSNYLWCRNPFADFASIPILPVVYSSHLLAGYFAPRYLMERVAYALDALNLLYVATTRAKTEMHLWLEPPGDFELPTPNSKKTLLDEYQDISILLRQVLKSVEGQGLYEEVEIGSELKGRWPSVHTSSSRTETQGQSLLITSLQGSEVRHRIEVLRRGLEYFTDNSRRTYGSLMHHILSDIERADDLSAAIAIAVREGLITEGDSADAERLIGTMLGHPMAQRWYDGSGKVVREIPIIGGGIPTSLRPDRLVLYPDGSAEVIDYKFGDKRSGHKRQVRGYIEILRQMGYSPVRGYLWYPEIDEIVEVLPD